MSEYLVKSLKDLKKDLKETKKELKQMLNRDFCDKGFYILELSYLMHNKHHWRPDNIDTKRAIFYVTQRTMEYLLNHSKDTNKSKSIFSARQKISEIRKLGFQLEVIGHDEIKMIPMKDEYLGPQERIKKEVISCALSYAGDARYYVNVLTSDSSIQYELSMWMKEYPMLDYNTEKYLEWTRKLNRLDRHMQSTERRIYYV